jgi:CheY-like chemotaxis protein
MENRNQNAILVVEDEPVVRMIAVEVLSDLGSPLYEAGDAAEALCVLHEHPEIELLFTDINMPGALDGLRLAHRVREARPDMKVVVTSGKHRLDASDLPERGVFLSKPYRANELLGTVRDQLRH